MRKNKTWTVNLFDRSSVLGTSNVGQGQNDEFWTNDTEAYLNFKPNNDSFEFTEAELTMYNKNDGSLVVLDSTDGVEIENNVVSYEMQPEIIAHFGKWTVQVRFIRADNESFTSGIIEYEVKRALGDAIPEKLSAMKNWDTFFAHAQETIDLISEAELARQEAEGKRGETYEKVKDLPEAFQNVIDETTGKDVISAPEIIAARRGKASLGEKIDEVTSQLAQTDAEARRKKELEDLSPTVLSAIEGGEGTSFDLLTIPQNNSVSNEKLDNKLQSYLGKVSSEGKNNLDGSIAYPTMRTVFNAIPTSVTGYIDTVTLNVATAGIGKLVVVSPHQLGYSIASFKNITIPTVGIVTLEENVDYDPIFINSGDFLAFFSEVAQLKSSQSGALVYGNREYNAGEVFTGFTAVASVDLKYTISETGQLIEDVEQLKADVKSNEPIINIEGNRDISSAAFLYSGESNTRIDNKFLSESGKLNSVTMRLNNSGSIKIKFFKKEGSIFTFKNEIVISGRDGLNTYKSGIDFESINVEKGWYIGFYSSANQPKVPFSNINGGRNSWTFDGIDLMTSGVPSVDASYNLLIEIGVLYDLAVMKTTVDSIGLRLGELSNATFEPESLLLDESFEDTTLSSNWENNGFNISSGAIFSGIGGLDKQLIWKGDSTLNSSNTRMWFTADSTAPDLALLKKHPLSAGVGGIYRVDGVNGKIIMYAPYAQNTSTLPTIIKDIDLPFDFVVGRQYLLELERRTLEHHTFRIVDTVTGITAELINEYIDTRVFSIGNGYTGVIGFGGDFTVDKIQVSSQEPRNPRLSLYGDSFVEGATIILDGLENRYADLLKAKLKGNMHINGRGGDHSTNLINKIQTDFKSEKSDYTVLAIGTNDSDFNTWLANITTLIEEVENKGSVPVLMTLTKMTSQDRTAFMTAVNDWILNSGHRYVDANLATTLNNDRQTQNSDLFRADGVHPNVDGHKVIYERFLIDVPEIFDGY